MEVRIEPLEYVELIECQEVSENVFRSPEEVIFRKNNYCLVLENLQTARNDAESIDPMFAGL